MRVHDLSLTKTETAHSHFERFICACQSSKKQKQKKNNETPKPSKITIFTVIFRVNVSRRDRIQKFTSRAWLFQPPTCHDAGATVRLYTCRSLRGHRVDLCDVTPVHYFRVTLSCSSHQMPTTLDRYINGCPLGLNLRSLVRKPPLWANDEVPHTVIGLTLLKIQECYRCCGSKK